MVLITENGNFIRLVGFHEISFHFNEHKTPLYVCKVQCQLCVVCVCGRERDGEMEEWGKGEKGRSREEGRQMDRQTDGEKSWQGYSK